MTNTITNSGNFIIGYNGHKPIVADVTYPLEASPLPILIFCHGYKGYKDWGAWHLVAEQFAKAGFAFLKFNFSHNGGTFENPIDFPDLEAFSEDNFTKQLDDLEQVISFVSDNKSPLPETDASKLYLIGHSRGGGIATIKTAENTHIKKLVTWASVSDYKSRLPQGRKLEEWKKDGVYYVKNGRTKQDMPHNIQFYEDFEQNNQRLDILLQAKRITQPTLIIHGEKDETVSTTDAYHLNESIKNSKLKFIENAGHTFNTAQPWKASKVPREMEEVITLTQSFLIS